MVIRCVGMFRSANMCIFSESIHPGESVDTLSVSRRSLLMIIFDSKNIFSARLFILKVGPKSGPARARPCFLLQKSGRSRAELNFPLLKSNIITGNGRMNTLRVSTDSSGCMLSENIYMLTLLSNSTLSVIVKRSL